MCFKKCATSCLDKSLITKRVRNLTIRKWYIYPCQTIGYQIKLLETVAQIECTASLKDMSSCTLS